MKKELFIKNLRSELTGIEIQEADEIVADYEEYFSAGIENGRSEEEIARSLGDPRVLAKQLRAESKVKRAEKNVSVSNILRAVLATAGLGLFNLIFISGPFFGLLGALLGLYAAGIAVFASGFASIVAGIFYWSNPEFFSQYAHIGVHPVVAILFGLSSACFGILFLIGCGYLTKLFFQGTVKYLKFNLKVIIGEKEQG